MSPIRQRVVCSSDVAAEHKAAIGLKDAIIAQTESELMHERMQRSLLRQRVLQAAKEGQNVEHVVEVDWEEGENIADHPSLSHGQVPRNQTVRVRAVSFVGGRSKVAANDSDRWDFCFFITLLICYFLIFFSLSQGSPCNVDVSALMELAAERGVHWKNYRTWIQKQVASQQQQQM